MSKRQFLMIFGVTPDQASRVPASERAEFLRAAREAQEASTRLASIYTSSRPDTTPSGQPTTQQSQTETRSEDPPTNS